MKSTFPRYLATRFPLTVLACLALALAAPALARETADPDPDFDRLDGMGRSAKKVNVIEWEGNLEIHVYPAGSLRGLALKLDKKNKDKPVMVIGYRFDSDPSKQFIRRAILGIDLREGFKAYRDPSADGYDKIVISNNGLSSPLAHFRLEAEPKQLYPEGHPALALPTDTASGADSREKRMPASRSREAEEEARLERRRQFEQQQAEADSESGTIKPFFREPRGGGTRH